MNLLTIIVVAVGLAMDAFAVSIAAGTAYRQSRISPALRMASFFGSFQAFMPLVGWLVGISLRGFIASWDHWLASVILSLVGTKMIYESFRIKQVQQLADAMGLGILLSLSVATSIDALAVGLTLSFLTDSVAIAVVIIGLITFIFSWLGVYIGKNVGHFFENKIEMLGGIALIGIGIKILIGHLFG